MSMNRHGGVEDRVWKHWKALKGHIVYRPDHVEDGLTPGGLVYGHYEPTTPNSVWLLLAETHKMPVRQVKDTINERRGKRNEGAHA